MGLLAAGTPLPWFESRAYNEFIQEEGIRQLLYVMKAASKRDNDPLYWGDELEYMLLEIDDAGSSAVLDVTNHRVITDLNTKDLGLCQANDVEYHPEYGRFMVEATPDKPYLGYMSDNYVEYNMEKRRKILNLELQQSGEDKNVRRMALTLTSFPILGATEEPFLNIKDIWSRKNSVSRSLFLPDEVINLHARFPTLTANIRTRRGEKVCINIPMYQDKNTPKTDTSIYERDWFIPEDMEAKVASKEGHIYMDSMGFGMGSSCLQTTYQAPNIDKARFLYDSLVNLAPIMLALSAASPIFKGWLADQDVRWNVIASSVDCRTPFERGEEPLFPEYNVGGYGGMLDRAKPNARKINKSRYSEVDLFLGGNKHYRRIYNDTYVPINETALNMMLENDVAPMDYDLARHFAHLFIRDPVSVFEESLHQNNETSTNHFENIQSTNWQTLRFKVPDQSAVPENKKAPGWRVEFRPCDVQITEFENAAYSVFIYLIVESILTFYDALNPYLPMSKVWENMAVAHHRDSVLRERFFWKKTFNDDTGDSGLYTIDEIFHNKENGLFNVYINPILRHKGFIKKDWRELKDSSSNQRLYYYLKLISDRAAGRIPTLAKFLRDFVINHPTYKHDSKVTGLINYDMILMSERITNLDNVNNEITALFGKETADYLLRNRITQSFYVK